MPGMNSGLNASNVTLTGAFRTALLHQGLFVLLVLTVLELAWISAREWLPASVRAAARSAVPRRQPAGRGQLAEPAGRRLLRIGFGIIWIFDGVLQAQSAMPAGLPGDVIRPTAAASPGWVREVVNWAGTTWSYHPIQAAAAAVWIQIGIGVWFLAAARGRPSRLAGLVSVGWGLVVWVFGEAFGGIFAPGLSWLFGAPGAVLFYCAAGALIALPEHSWQSVRLGRLVLDGMGLFFVGMAVLQAWPGRGFWQGTLHGHPAALTSMVDSMAGTPQPAFLAGWVRGFGSFAAANGFAVNLVAVVLLAAIGAGLLSRQPRLTRAAVVVMFVVCLADWVLIQDLGFLGGLGTDPNSMIPMFLLVAGGYLALVRAPAAELRDPAGQPAAALAWQQAVPSAAAQASRPGWRERIRPASLARAFGAASTRTVLAAWAAAVVLVGAAPMALAQTNPTADPIIAQAISGSSDALNFPAPAFQLTDQSGGQVTLASLRGKVVLLTFLDPVCTSDCPLIAQEFRQADHMLGAAARRVELVAIVANPLYRATTYTRAFDRQEGMSSLPNWRYLTGSLSQLRRVWREYGIAAQILPAGGMIAHSDVAFVINAAGRTRTELDFDPGPGTAASKSSFAAELASAAERFTGSP
jgi:cytochrome oxidase Cu insertion factor (SCO1/SenC/PrrC family)